MDLAEEVGGEDGADGEEHEPEDQVADPAGGDPEQADEEGEEQGGEADVVLQADDHHGDAPGHQDGDERSGVEHEPVAEAGRGDGQQLLVGGEVGGEEDAEEDLGELDRLELEAAEVDPQPGPVDGGEEERGDQQDAADQQEQVAVALEVAGEAHHQQRERRRGPTPMAAQPACDLALAGSQRAMTT